MITRHDIETELSAGMNIFCATCMHHYEGKEHGLRSCLDSVSKTCGGPMRGQTFPKYKGIIPRSRFNEICLVCGDPSIVKSVSTSKCGNVFSLCEAHQDSLSNLEGTEIMATSLWRKI